MEALAPLALLDGEGRLRLANPAAAAAWDATTSGAVPRRLEDAGLSRALVQLHEHPGREVLLDTVDGGAVRLRGAGAGAVIAAGADGGQRWQFALDGSEDGLWDWEIARRRVYFSPAWKAQLGYAEDELLDDPIEWEVRVHPDDREPTLAQLRRHLQGGDPQFNVVYRLRHRDGGWRWLLARGKVVAWSADGHPLRMVGTHRDVTEEREATLALERARAQTARFHRGDAGTRLRARARRHRAADQPGVGPLPVAGGARGQCQPGRCQLPRGLRCGPWHRRRRGARDRARHPFGDQRALGRVRAGLPLPRTACTALVRPAGGAAAGARAAQRGGLAPRRDQPGGGRRAPAADRRARARHDLPVPPARRRQLAFSLCVGGRAFDLRGVPGTGRRRCRRGVRAPAPRRPRAGRRDDPGVGGNPAGLALRVSRVPRRGPGDLGRRLRHAATRARRGGVVRLHHRHHPAQADRAVAGAGDGASCRQQPRPRRLRRDRLARPAGAAAQDPAAGGRLATIAPSLDAEQRDYLARMRCGRRAHGGADRRPARLSRAPAPSRSNPRRSRWMRWSARCWAT